MYAGKYKVCFKVAEEVCSMTIVNKLLEKTAKKKKMYIKTENGEKEKISAFQRYKSRWHITVSFFFS